MKILILPSAREEEATIARLYLAKVAKFKARIPPQHHAKFIVE